MAVDPLQELAEARAAGTEPVPEEGAEPQQPEPEGQEPEPVHPILERFGGDVNKLAEAYAQADSFIGRQGSEMGQRIQVLEETLAAAQQPPPSPQPAGQSSEWPDLTADQFQQWMEDDPMAASAYMSAKTVEAYRDEIRREIAEELQPLRDSAGRNTATNVADALRRSLGNDVVDSNMQMLQQEIKANPGLLQGDQTQVYKNLRRIVTDAEWERGSGRATPARRADVPAPHVEGGSGGRPMTQSEPELSPEEIVKQALLDDQPQRDPVFGATRRP